MKRIKNKIIVFFLFPMLCLVSYIPCQANESSKDKNNTEASLADEAFDQSLQSFVPLTQEQIRKFMERVNKTSETVHSTPPPKMNNRTRRFSLESGHKPPVLKVAPGYVSSVAFFDASGQPWPITSIVVGNPKFYNVQKPQDLKPGNMFIVTALKKHVDSNIVLTLKDHDMPVTVQVETVDRSKKNVSTDATIAFQADKRGPMAKAPQIGPGLQSTVNETMLTFLDGVPPADATRKNIKPEIESVNLWEYNGKYYFRSKYEIVWPAWVSITKGVGNINVYELENNVPSIMISKNGKTLSLEVSDG